MLKRPQSGPEALRIDITPMTNPAYVAVEANVHLAANADLVTALEGIAGVTVADVQDAYTLMLHVDNRLPKLYLVGQLEGVVRQHCQL